MMDESMGNKIQCTVIHCVTRSRHLKHKKCHSGTVKPQIHHLVIGHIISLKSTTRVTYMIQKLETKCNTF